MHIYDAKLLRCLCFYSCYTTETQCHSLSQGQFDNKPVVPKGKEHD